MKSSDQKIIIERKPLPDLVNKNEDSFTQGLQSGNLEKDAQQSQNGENQSVEPEKTNKSMVIENEAKQQADQIIAAAEKEAQAYLEKAQQEQERLIQEIDLQAQQTYDQASSKGYEEGYAQGEQKGKQDGESSYAIKIQEVNNLIKQVQAQSKNELLNAADLIVELALEITQKVLTNNSEFLQEQIVTTVTKALEKVRNIEKIDLHINPSDYELVNEAMPNLKQYLSGRAEIAIQLEQHIESGGCVIHTSMGTIDSRISTQLLEIRKAIEALEWGSEIVDEA